MDLRRSLTTDRLFFAVCLLYVSIPTVLYIQLHKTTYNRGKTGTNTTLEKDFRTVNNKSVDFLSTIDTQLYKTLLPRHIRVGSTGVNTTKDEAFRTITILAYSRSIWMTEWIDSKLDPSSVFQSCPLYKNCILTTNLSLVNKVDAVVFNWTKLWREEKKLKKRKQGQVWILLEMEPPDRYQSLHRIPKFKHINWTASYRRDSDFTLPYGEFVQHDTGYKVSEQYELLRSKSKTAVGFISHCNASSKREEFIRKLRSYGVDIDIYGECGNLKCGGDKKTKWMHVWNVTQTHPDPCLKVLNTKYKFYLSFENALCEDYVTEKSLHHVLSKQIVPVVRSGANPTLFHPPQSSLNTKDFKNIKSLAKRMIFLSENFDQYLKYFDWRRHYTVETLANPIQSVYCDMCHRLHHQDRYKRLYGNLNNFLLKSHDTHSDGICKEANDL